ncbi:MAG: hypothetical protein ACXWL2_01105 [Candidatus Chromulinivorax sp.]
MKNIKILTMLIAYTTGFYVTALADEGQLTNNSNGPVNVVFYLNYIPPTDKNSPKGRINKEGVIIPAGNSVSFAPKTTSIDIYYTNGMIHANVNSSNNYTILPSAKINAPWTLTAD